MYAFFCPEKIRRHISYGSYNAAKEFPNKILVSCPRDLYPRSQGFARRKCHWRQPTGFQLSPGTKFPPLNYLRQHGHDFDNQSLDSAEIDAPMIGRTEVSGCNADDQTSNVRRASTLIREGP